jgi:hypothetical protein
LGDEQERQEQQEGEEPVRVNRQAPDAPTERRRLLAFGQPLLDQLLVRQAQDPPLGLLAAAGRTSRIPGGAHRANL